MNDRRIDLHMHSNYSDGVHAPSVLVDLAKWKGISAIALCDHDSLDGFPELAASGREAGVEVLTGVELSCEHAGRDLHVLGYGVDFKNEKLQSALREFRAARERRGIRIVELLHEHGVHIDIEKVLAKAAGGALGRPHIAEAMLEAGYITDHAEAFAKYIGEGCAGLRRQIQDGSRRGGGKHSRRRRTRVRRPPRLLLGRLRHLCHAARPRLRRRRGVSSLPPCDGHRRACSLSRASADS